MLHRALRKVGLRRGYREVEVDIVLERCGKTWGSGWGIRLFAKACLVLRLGCCLGDLLGIRRIGSGSEIG